jgi:hypothetical protein
MLLYEYGFPTIEPDSHNHSLTEELPEKNDSVSAAGAPTTSEVILRKRETTRMKVCVSRTMATLKVLNRMEATEDTEQGNGLRIR